mgnify:CR=1 FL=1
MEKTPENLPEESRENREGSVFFTRHSKAGYKTYAEILKSDDPTAPVDPERQVVPDLPEAGVELARDSAEEFLDTLDPETDQLFFASSNEARALETAAIYKEVAETKGFEIIKPEHVRGELAEEIGGGDIRVVDALSLNIKNNLLSSVFNPSAHVGEVNLEALDPKTLTKWNEARAIIEAGDRDSWGANFYEYGEEIQKIFPELKTSRELYETKFKNLLRLAEFGLKKAEESSLDKNIKILAFGHENYMGYALNKYFGEHEIKNCETLTIKPAGENLAINRRGEEASL